jgi:Na+/pantothenate symporter
MRLFIAVFIVISAVIAIVQAKSTVTFIAQLMGISWGALAGAFLAPFVCVLYWKKTRRLAVVVNFIFAPVVMLANLFYGAYFPGLLQSPINCGAAVMLSGFIIVPLLSIFPAPRSTP